MKYSIVPFLALVGSQQYVDAFTPTAFTRPAAGVGVGVGVGIGTKTQMNVMMDPSMIHDSISNVFSSFTALADDGEMLESVSNAAASAVAEVTANIDANEVAQTATDVADATDNGNGWFGFLAGPIEGLLQIIHSTLVGVGMPANAWGVSIVIMTSVIKLLTYPLTKQQLTSTSKMQGLQPQIKSLQAKYQSNPEVMNQKISEVYQTNDVNPLAGCIPSIVQLPVFIGLYRAVLSLAKENKLNEPFLWLPNLEGPTYGADPSHASDWLFSGWVNGAPSLGWDDTLAFLTIPVILVLSQFASMQIMTPKVEGQEQPAFVKFLPLLIGYFSLNVPAALGIYWVANNFITTALTMQIRSGIQMPDPVTGGGGGGGAVLDAEPTAFTPATLGEKPAGFGASSWDDDDEVTPITPMDAEVVAQEFVENDDSTPPRSNKKRGGKKKKKRRN